jgi:hypothetical protein
MLIIREGFCYNEYAEKNYASNVFNALIEESGGNFSPEE